MEIREKYLETISGPMWFEDNIFCFQCYPGTIYDANLTHQFLEDRPSIWDDKTYPVFGDVRVGKYWTKDAKELCVQPKYVDKFSAIALWVESPVLQTLINFFLKFYHTPVPVKLFTNADKAKEWLKTFHNISPADKHSTSL